MSFLIGFFVVIAVCAVCSLLYLIALLLIYGPSAFSSEPHEEDDDLRRRKRDEEQNLLKDLKSSKRGGVDVVKYVVGTSVANLEREALAEFGIAENQTATEQDTEGAQDGEYWVCDRRPFWLVGIFSALTSLFVTPIAFFVSPILLIVIAAVFWVVVGATIMLFTAYKMENNERLGVRFGGRKQRGFLGEGFQFLVPLVESAEFVPLRTLIWGPEVGESNSDFHLNGALGTTLNPRPGIFVVQLLGRWDLNIQVQVTLRVRRAFRRAWYKYLNEYESPEEIAQQLASIIGTVLSREVREISQVTLSKTVESEIDALETEAEKDAARLVARWIGVLNRIPEISAQTLLTLHELGRERLAGILVMSIQFPEVTPGKGFQELLQDIDKAKAQRVVKYHNAKGETARLREFEGFVREVYPRTNAKSRRALVRLLERLYTQRQFAEQSNDPVSALVKGLAGSQTQQLKD